MKFPIEENERYEYKESLAQLDNQCVCSFLRCLFSCIGDARLLQRKTLGSSSFGIFCAKRGVLVIGNVEGMPCDVLRRVADVLVDSLVSKVWSA